MNAVVDLPRSIHPAITSLSQTAIDLSDISFDQMSELRLCVAEYRLSVNRVMNEYFHLTQQVVKMQELLGTRFYPFVQAELGISDRTARRYLHINKVLQAHFSTDGRINVAQVQQISRSAFQLLSPETDDDVINEIRSLADQGVKVDESAVRRIIESREKELEAELASVSAEKEILEKELNVTRESSEVQVARAKNEAERTAAKLDRAEQLRAALEEEIKELQSKATIVNEVPKEVLPAGYTTAIEATNAANQLLAEAQQKRKDVEAEIADLKNKSSEIQRNIAEIQGGADEFLKLKEQLDAIIAKYPQARMEAMSSIDPAIKKLMKGIGEAMMQFGKELQSVSK